MPVIGFSFDSSGCMSSYRNLLKSGQTSSAPRNINLIKIWSLISYLSRNEQFAFKG